MIRRLLLIAIAFLAVGLSTGVQSTKAQSPDEYQIVVPLSLINQPTTRPDAPTVGAALETLTVRAEEITCTTAIIEGSTSDVLLHIGAAGQPPACGIEGARLQLIDSSNRVLSQTFTIRRGTRDTLTNLAPVPPGSGGQQAPEVSSAEFRVIIPAAVLNEGAGIGNGWTPGRSYETITAHADGTACVTANVVDPTSDVVLHLGLPDQPPVCRQQGAEVTFRISQGTRLVERATLVLGSQVVLRSIGIEPPVDPGPLPQTTPPLGPAPAITDRFPTPPPPQRSGTVKPPDTGDAGLR